MNGNPTILIVARMAQLTSISKTYLETTIRYKLYEPSQCIPNQSDVTPAMILYLPDVRPDAIAKFAVAIRTRRDKLADIPLIAPTPERTDRLGDVLIDDWLNEDAKAEDVRNLIERWSFAANGSIDRLCIIFGRPAVIHLITKLRLLLRESLASPQAARIDDTAHRLIGACGTLGYSDASRAWLTFLDNPERMTEVIRITRKTIYQIGCDLERLYHLT